ncbi:hypothetical protein [Stenotrophomonas sp.]|uniref:hypothetical protein n=1 Tax=Stenotrophomonas sp. TaxID=69392 RepID=UPI0028A93E43|nr:hypothetical protein [Stenotrophomonas sp.]
MAKCKLDAEHSAAWSGRIHSYLAAVVLSLGLQGCDWLSDPVIVVKNVGRDVIYDVSLEVGGGVVGVGSISVGESRVVKPEVAADSSLLVTYYENNVRVVCQGDVYFTNNLHVKVEADVGGGVCRIGEVAD